MPRGGARSGAGRKPGAVTLRTREIVEKVMMQGITPLELMLDNMRVAHRKAKKLEAKLRSETDETDAAETLAKAFKFREMPQSAAREAAPYMHPRLAAIEARLTPQK